MMTTRTKDKRLLVDKWPLSNKLADGLASLLKMVREQQEVRSEDAVKQLALNPTTAKRYLHQLVKMGLITAEGGNRNGIYREVARD
jgi:DNA-binding IscR family transcriptional regulator